MEENLEEEIDIYNKVLSFLIKLRDVGEETKYHIYDVLDPDQKYERKKQFVAIALVSELEILDKNFSVFQDFTDYLHTISDEKQVSARIVNKGRIAVALNSCAKDFFEHGECRLLDPNKKILNKIIPEGLEKTNLGELGQMDKDIMRRKNVELKVLKNMKRTYKLLFKGFSDAVLLLFSHYIPCSIDFHQCSRLIRKFVEISGFGMVIGYESVYEFTDELESLEWLDDENILVVDCDMIREEIRNQMAHLMTRDIFGIKYEFIDEDSDDDFEGSLEDFSDDVWDCQNMTHSRKFRKDLCREIVKTYNNFQYLYM